MHGEISFRTPIKECDYCQSNHNGTKYLAILSTVFNISLFCAVSTSLITSSILDVPLLEVALMTMLPSKTTLPAHTEFPEVIDTGMLSPVIAVVSISVFPDNTIPSGE